MFTCSRTPNICWKNLVLFFWLLYLSFKNCTEFYNAHYGPLLEMDRCELEVRGYNYVVSGAFAATTITMVTTWNGYTSYVFGIMIAKLNVVLKISAIPVTIVMPAF